MGSGDENRKPTNLCVCLQESHQIGCSYTTSPLKPTLSTGCAKYCNATRKVRVNTSSAALFVSCLYHVDFMTMTMTE